MKLKLFPKIAILLILLATVPAAIVGWRTFRLNKVYLENNILELHTNLANSLSDRINLFLNVLAEKSRTVVESLIIQGSISVQALQTFVNSNDEFVSIAFINKQGKELVKAVSFAYPEELILKDHSENSIFKYYQSQKIPEGEQYSPILKFNFDHRIPRLVIIFPYNPKNFSQGAFYIIVSLSKLWEEISKEGAGVGGGGRDAFIVDENGDVIFHSRDPNLALNRVSFKDHPIVMEGLQKKSIGSKEYQDGKGHAVVGAYSDVKSTRWVAVVEQPKETAYYPIFQTRKSALQIVLISIIAAALIAFLFAKNLTRPIFALIEGARKVAKGEFGHSVHVKSKDEMSDLAKTFNEMTQELKRYDDLQVDRIIQEKTKTESVIFSIADGIILTDHNGIIQLLNKPAVSVFGLEQSFLSATSRQNSASVPEENSLVGKNLFDILEDSDLKKTLRELLSQPQSKDFKEVVLTKGKERQWYQLSCEVVNAPKTGKNVGVVTVIHDVTLEREMDELKENFLHSITHDLRNPMTSIVGFIKFMLDGVAGTITDQQRLMLDTMSRASSRLLGMINDILDIAKIEAGKLEIELNSVNLADIIKEVRALYLPLAEKKSIQLTVHLPENVKEESLVINGDESQIERTISNLVANAVKFTPHEGKVEIQLENFSDKLQVTVNDNGPGIAQEYLGKVFDRFQQIKGHKQGGTGIGLTICKYFVQLHKGNIWVESQLGVGTKFIFWIPKGLVRLETGEITIEHSKSS